MGDVIEIVGDTAYAMGGDGAGRRTVERQVGLRELLGGIAPSLGTSQGDTTLFLPAGTRYVKVRGASTGLVVELPPEIRRVTWSPATMDRGGAYSAHWLALPPHLHP